MSSFADDRSLFSRRRLLAASGLAAIGSLTPEIAQAAAVESEGVDYYAKLGIPTIINAAGTYTYLTAAVMAPPVQRAVAIAARHPVRLKELQIKAGEYIAKRLQCEGALISAGASAALTLATAACISYKTGAVSDQVPQIARDKKLEVIVQKRHRYEYDHAMQICGVSIVEVETLEQYRNAFNERTVMTNYFNAEGPEADRSIIDRETWLKVAHEHDVPCHNDAAADMPPVSNLWKYTKMGFDLVCFSGGKGIRGPQNAGLLLGRKKLIDLAATHNNPNSDAVGRGMKVAKEQLVGMVAAVDWILDQNDEAMQQEYMRRVHVIESAVKSIPGVTTSVNIPEVANHVPHLLIRYDASKVGMDGKEIAKKLSAGTPSIELNPATGSKSRIAGADEHTIVVGVWMLQPGEDKIVGSALKRVLTQA